MRNVPKNENSRSPNPEFSEPSTDAVGISIIPELKDRVLGQGGYSQVSGRAPGGPEGGVATGEKICAAACHKAQIDRKFSYFSVWKGGTLLKVSRNRERDVDCEGRGKRSQITDFTWETRVRILRTLGMMDKLCLPAYWVATYPDEAYSYMATGEWTVKTFDAFRERIRYKYPECGVVWRREHERRKSGLHIGEFFPHYNFLFWGVDVGELNMWLPRAWYGATGELSEKQLSAVWFAERVKSWKQMIYYLSKYVAKKNKDYFGQPGWGAWWGTINKDNLPWVSPIEIEVSDKQATTLLRYVKRKAHGKRNLDTRYLTTENPDFWVQRLGDILDLTPE